ncbi:MAG: response regulator transcription factor [Bacteroidales bacterium]|nr:response regulator transcription factor [Bacteroidales bacterium]
MNLRCVIVDDEPLAIAIIEDYLKKIPFIEVVGKFENVIPVYQFLKENQIDLLFLDIEMPNITGIDFLKTLINKPSVIITTANKNFAVEGFDLNVDDYILKPITFDRLLKGINRVVESKNKNNVRATNEQQNDFLYLKENKKMVKVYLKDILYLESIKDYAKVVTTEKTVITKQQLSFFESINNTNKFLRIHRSFIVAIDKIDSYSLSGIEVGDKELPIGRKFKDIVIEALENHSNSDFN